MAALLPKRTVRIQWNFASVPDSVREAIETARDRAFQQVGIGLTDISYEEVQSNPDIKIGFVRSIPQEAGQPFPPGAAFMFSELPGGARLEAVIALERGGLSSTPADFQNEIQYALGSYFGIAANRLASTLMARTDLSQRIPNRSGAAESNLINQGLKIADQLRAAVEKRRTMEPAIPQIRLSDSILQHGEVVQGQQVPMSVQVTNTGNAPLALRIKPDCSCVVTVPSMRLEAGDTGLISVVVDTTEVSGELQRTLVVLSNDIDFPVKEIPIRFKVVPRFRFVAPGGDTLLMRDGGVGADVYLLAPADRPLQIKDVRLDGLPGRATFEAWSGKLAEPGLSEPEKERKGYKIKIWLEDSLPAGRALATLLVRTDDPKFDVVRYNFGAQKGIVAVPDSIYLGEISRKPKTFSFLLSRPQSDFEIVKIESGNKNLAAKSKPARGRWEHKVTLEYDGKAELGKLETVLTIATNDPKQPTIRVPVRGSVR